jgi:acylphosphatase
LKKHFNITVYGKVQGVFYRATTKFIADQLGVKGYVKNQNDQTVYIEAEATPFLLEQFLDWCKEGPERAEVEKVEQQESELKNYINFDIRK